MNFLQGNNIFIASAGSCLPEKKILNDELDKNLNTSDEWIFTRTGIKQRYISNLENNENTATLGFKAALDAISKMKDKFDKNSINLIIVATTTPNKIFPSVSAQIAGMLDLPKDVIVFDLQAVCSGFLYAYIVASNMMTCNSNIKNALVIGSETMSEILDWNDRSTCILFGDGAGAVILERNQDKQDSILVDCASLNSGPHYQRGLIDSILRSNGKLDPILYAKNKNDGLKMNGREVFVTATNELSLAIKQLCEKNNIKLEQIEKFLIHQSNARILKFLGENLGVPESKIPVVISEYANTSAASIPILINDVYNDIKKDSLVIIAAVGAGMVWGVALVRW